MIYILVYTNQDKKGNEAKLRTQQYKQLNTGVTESLISIWSVFLFNHRAQMFRRFPYLFVKTRGYTTKSLTQMIAQIVLDFYKKGIISFELHVTNTKNNK